MPGQSYRKIEIPVGANIREFEAQLVRAGVIAKEEGGRIGTAFDEGTSKAAAGLSKLSAMGASFGVPMIGSLDAIGKKLDETNTKHQRLLGTMAEAGKVALTGGIAAFAAAAYEGVKGAMALQQQMEMLHTQAGASQAEVVKMTAAVENMAGSLGTSPLQLAQGLYHVESAGMRGAQALQILKVAAEGAKVGNANLEDVTNALDAAVVSGISGVQNYGQAMGALNAIVGAGDMKMQDLADAMSTGLLATMKVAGVSLRDTGAALALFGDNNIRGADAATKLRQAVLGMATPTTAADKWLKAIGMSSLQMADDMRSGGLLKAIDDLRTHLQQSGATASQQADIIANVFGRRAQVGVDLMLTQFDRLKQKYQEVGSGATHFSESVAATHKTLQFQVDQLKASVQALGDKFGAWLIPKLEATAHAINNVVDWLQKHKTAAEVLAGVIGGVLATAIAAYAYTKAVAFVNATKSMVTGLAGLASSAGSVASTVAEKLGLISSTSAATATEVGSSDAAIEASNTAAGASFATMATEAGAAEAEALAAMGSLASGVEAADASIETSNAAAAASFTAMLGPIGAAAAAVGGLGYAISQIQNSPSLPSSSPSATFGRRGIGGQSLTSWAAQHGMSIGGGGSIPANATTLLNGRPLPGGGATGPGGPWTGANGQVTAASFAASLLSRLGAPTNQANIDAIVGWINREGNNPSIDKYNPLDTTIGGFGGVSTNSVGVKSFANWAQGLAATVATLRQSNFAAILASLKAGQGLSGMGVAGELSAWSGGGYSSATPANVPNPVLAALLNGTSTAKKHVRSIRSLLYANPLPGMTSVGRTDMGVDFSATPGSAVDAIGAGIVTAVIQNWYKGQPLIEERLTQGPNKGQYVYYAEQLRSAVRVGQRLLAGQQIGTVAGSGTGLELGFGASGGRTLAQATTGYIEGQQTPAGKAFLQFFRSIGSGVYTTTSGGITTGGGQNFATTVSQLIQQFMAQLTKAGDALATKLSNAMQDGTLKVLENLLGFSSSAMVRSGHPAGWLNLATGLRSGGYSRTPASTVLNHLIEGLGGGASIHQINTALSGTVSSASAGSPQTAAFNSLIANLIAAGQKNLADRLVAEHKAAMATLAQELYADQKTRDAELLNLQSTALKDQTQAAANAAQDGLSVLKAFQQAQLDKVQQQTTQIDDMTQIMRDSGAAMVQSMQDATTVITDSLNAVATGINDQTQTRVDILGERGLFGLNLIAQQLKVVADETKTYWDQQIALAQQNLDQVTIAAHSGEAAAQIALDQAKYQQDLKVAQAQTAADLLTIRMTAAIAQAQAHADAVLLHEDASVVGPAQIAYDLSATLPRAQQDVYKAQLAAAQGTAGMAEGQANAWLSAITNYANAQMAGAQGSYNQALADAALAESQANQTLVSVTNAANAAIAGAQQTLASTQGQAGIAEAQATGAVSVAGARAQTQFAGSGLTVNIYGIPVTNAAAIGDTMDWFARTAGLPT